MTRREDEEAVSRTVKKDGIFSRWRCHLSVRVHVLPKRRDCSQHAGRRCKENNQYFEKGGDFPPAPAFFLNQSPAGIIHSRMGAVCPTRWICPSFSLPLALRSAYEATRDATNCHRSHADKRCTYRCSSPIACRAEVGPQTNRRRRENLGSQSSL